MGIAGEEKRGQSTETSCKLIHSFIIILYLLYYIIILLLLLLFITNNKRHQATAGATTYLARPIIK
jgi:hypothetical protein